jgi:hypothetical protein
MINQIVLHVHQTRLVIQINSVTAVAVGIQCRRITHVVDLVVQNLIARRRVGVVTGFDGICIGLYIGLAYLIPNTPIS